MAVTVNFIGGANRPGQPHPSVMAALQAAGNASLPSGSTLTVYSGTGEYGSSRHRASTGYLGQSKFGLAADVKVSLPGGQKVTADTMKALGQAWASITKGGVGYGKNYMGVDNIHLDIVTQDMLGPKQGMTWGGGTTGWNLADFRNGTKTVPGVSPTMLADANVPIPATRPEDFSLSVADIMSRPTDNPWAGLFSQPTAAADELAANIAQPGLLASALAPAPTPEVQQAMLASLPGALPAAPVSPVSVASLAPVTQYSSLPAAPVQSVTNAPLQNVPSNAYSAPVGPVERGLLTDLPSSLAAAPVGAVENGGMLRPASEPSFTGNPNLSEMGQFAPALTVNGTAPSAFQPSYTKANGDTVISADMDGVGSFSFGPAGQAVAPVTADPNFGAVSTEQGLLADAPASDPYSMFGVGPTDPGMTLNAQTPTYGGIDAMTALSNASMANLPAISPDVPLDLTSIPVPATKPLPALPPAVEVPQYTVASPAPVSRPAPQAMSVPSGMDVWSGISNYGIATDGTALSRNPDGTVTRTNTYGVTETYNPSTQGWLPGGPTSRTPGFSLPSKERAVQLGKETLAPMAGGLLGSALLGPIGGLLASAVARNMVQGSGILGNQAPSPNSIGAQNQIAATFGYSGATPGAGDPMDRGYAPAAHDSIARGETVGLF